MTSINHNFHFESKISHRVCTSVLRRRNFQGLKAWTSSTKSFLTINTNVSQGSLPISLFILKLCLLCFLMRYTYKYTLNTHISFTFQVSLTLDLGILLLNINNFRDNIRLGYYVTKIKMPSHLCLITDISKLPVHPAKHWPFPNCWLIWVIVASLTICLQPPSSLPFFLDKIYQHIQSQNYAISW